MTTKTKIIIGVVIVAVAATAYYFLVYKPKKDKENEVNTGGGRNVGSTGAFNGGTKTVGSAEAAGNMTLQ